METDTVVIRSKELSMSRLINAPVDLVWKVWTDPEHIRNWWGPNGFTNIISKMEVKPGGEWDFVMHGPDGRDYKNKNVFKELVKNEKIVYDHVSAPKHQSTITFNKKGNKTLVSIQMIFETAEERDNTVKTFKADIGLKQNVYRLEAYLKKVSAEKEMTLSRIINAPREMVFRAWIEKDQLEKWWGPKDFTNPVCDVDFVPGGNILIHMQAPDGTLYPMNGEFHEIVEPEKIVFTSAALDKNGNRLFEVLNTVTFDDEKGKTKLTLHAAVSHITDEGRPYLDGMNEGWNQSIDRLNDLVSNQNEGIVVLERTFNAPIEKVWQALTDVDQMKAWYFPQLEDFKPQEGFTTTLNIQKEGKDYPHIWKVTEVKPLKKISLEWKYGGFPGNSLLSFELFPEDDKTRLLLTHEKLDTFIPGKHPELSKKNFMSGWKYFMDTGLKEFLEKG